MARTQSTDCCIECFEDESLKAFITEHGEPGECAFCGASNVLCIAPYELTELFDPLIGLYEIVDEGVNRMPDTDPTTVGDRLADRIDDDWQIFSDRVSEQKHNLLGEIANAYTRHGEDIVDVDDLWTERSNAFTSRSLADLWGSFAFNLRYQRRYIPKKAEPGELADPREILEGALPRVEGAVAAGTKVFRARLGFKSEGPLTPYPVEEMGAPPSSVARAGRMNPAGIPYLYLARSEYTAVAEVRPWKGAYVSVARYVLPKDYRVADLTNIPGIRPFEVTDLNVAVEQQLLLRYLGREFSRPVNPNSADVDYVPTQYLAEFIQEYGFEGVQYPSALGREPNLVIFDCRSASPEGSWLREVKGTSYTFGKPTRYSHYDEF